MVKIDRVSGKRVFGGEAQDDVPKASIIWEAFKPDTEPKREAHGGDIAEEREELYALLHQSRDNRLAAAQQAANPGRVEDFVEEQGGVY
jgi:penicillin-binding protein 1A